MSFLYFVFLQPQFNIYLIPPELSSTGLAYAKSLVQDRVMTNFEVKYGIVQFLPRQCLRRWLDFTMKIQSKHIVLGVFRDAHVDSNIVDGVLSLYMMHIIKEGCTWSMARPHLCAAIALQAAFNRIGMRGSAAWKLVYDHEKLAPPKEKVALSEADFVKLFEFFGRIFRSITQHKGPYRRQHFWDIAGLTTIILTCIMLFRAGNVLDATADPKSQDPPEEHEALLEDLIRYRGDEEIIFRTQEKQDKLKGTRTPGREVVWLLSSYTALLKPARVIDVYLEMHDMSRGSRCGPISKPVKHGKSSFTPSDFRKWLRGIAGRFDYVFESLRGKNLTPRSNRRSAITWFCRQTGIVSAQHLAGHAHLATTEQFYVTLKQEEQTLLRSNIILGSELLRSGCDGTQPPESVVIMSWPIPLDQTNHK